MIQIGRLEQQGGHTLKTGRIVAVESIGLGAVEVEHSPQLLALQQRDDEFRTRRGVTGDVSRKLMHILDDERLTSRRRRAAHSLAEGDAYACDLALERPEHQLPVL